MKTKYFFYAILSFLVVGYTVYSWTEPTTMPSSYNPPINTSITAQTKTGEIGASIFRDADDSGYYINPSGNSVVSGTISAAKPTANTHIATKEYVDSLLSTAEEELSLSNLVYITGTENPLCPDGTIGVLKHWLPGSCTGGTYNVNCPGATCTTPVIWADLTPPTCDYNSTVYPSCTRVYHVCNASKWDSIICAKVGEPLHEIRHTAEQCSVWGGEVVIVEGDKKICRLSAATCPFGWAQYKNWSTTRADTISYYGSCPCTTGSHAWGDALRESCVNEYNKPSKLGSTPYCRAASSSCGSTYYDGTSSFSIDCGIENTCATLCGKAVVEQIGCY